MAFKKRIRKDSTVFEYQEFLARRSLGFRWSLFLTQPQVALLTYMVLLHKQTKDGFSTSKVKISIWILTHGNIRTNSGFRFLNLLSWAAMFSLFSLNTVVEDLENYAKHTLAAWAFKWSRRPYWSMHLPSVLLMGMGLGGCGGKGGKALENDPAVGDWARDLRLSNTTLVLKITLRNKCKNIPMSHLLCAIDKCAT